MPWYTGPQLVPYLETIEVATDRTAKPMRFPVQWVNRPNLDFRGFSGTVASGVVTGRRRGARRRVAQAGQDHPHRHDGRRPRRGHRRAGGDAGARPRGRYLARRRADPSGRDAGILQPVPGAHDLDERRAGAFPGRSYLLKIGSQLVPATITDLKFRTNVNTLEQSAAKTLELNEVGTLTIATDKPIAFDSYASNGLTGAFILIDRISNATLGAGRHRFRPAPRAEPQLAELRREPQGPRRDEGAGRRRSSGSPASRGSGKSTVANLVEKKLSAEGRHAYILDGDNVRHGLNKDLGFTEEARVENIRRVAEVARLMADAGLIVLVSFISPFRNERRLAREIAGDIEFTEVYVDTPLEVCEARDPKGLYARARRGEIKNFTGIDSPFEAPEAARDRAARRDRNARDDGRGAVRAGLRLAASSGYARSSARASA